MCVSACVTFDERRAHTIDRLRINLLDSLLIASMKSCFYIPQGTEFYSCYACDFLRCQSRSLSTVDSSQSIGSLPRALFVLCQTVGQSISFSGR